MFDDSRLFLKSRLCVLPRVCETFEIFRSVPVNFLPVLVNTPFIGICYDVNRIAFWNTHVCVLRAVDRCRAHDGRGSAAKLAPVDG